jgi:MscS family membrane protein
LGYDTSADTIESLCGGIRELLSSHPFVKQDAIAVHLASLSQPGLGVFIQFFLALKNWGDEMKRKEEIFYAILKLCEKLGVRLAPPPQAVEIVATPGRPMSRPTALSPMSGITAARAISVGWTRTTS